MMRASAALVALFGATLGACSSDATPSYEDVVFASATVDNIEVGAGVTNLVFATLTAPTPGTLTASATGNCMVVADLPVGSGVVTNLETSATDDTEQPGEAIFLLHNLDDFASFSTQRTETVASGPQAIYLNLDNPSTGGTIACSASLTLLYASTSLESAP
jgi:hypothetical protein